jgi:hypothetical protein
MGTRHKLTRFAAGAIGMLGFGLCGASPPPEGTEIDASAGYGARRYVIEGCGTAPPAAELHRELNAHTQITHRFENGFTLSGEAALLGDQKSGDPGPSSTGMLAQRLGYSGSRAGFELGPAELWDGKTAMVLPSGAFWAGVPELVYGWADFVAGPLSLAAVPVGAGIGGAPGDLRWKVGVMASAVESLNVGAAGHVEGAYRVAPGLWLGASGDLHDKDTWKTQLSVAFALGRD